MASSMRCVIRECMVKHFMHGQLECNSACLACFRLHSEALHYCSQQCNSSAKSDITFCSKCCSFTCDTSESKWKRQLAFTIAIAIAGTHYQMNCLHSFGLHSFGNVWTNWKKKKERAQLVSSQLRTHWVWLAWVIIVMLSLPCYNHVHSLREPSWTVVYVLTLTANAFSQLPVKHMSLDPNMAVNNKHWPLH